MAKFEDLYEETFILNIDFLGFSNFVENNDKKLVINFFTQWISDINFVASGLCLQGEDAKESIDSQAYFDRLSNNSHIEIMVYSDTIAIKSHNPNKNKHFYELVKLAEVIQHDVYDKVQRSYPATLFIRGTITYGEFIFYKGGMEFPSAFGNNAKIKTKNISIILGKAIIDAYKNEKDMEIMTIGLTENCIKQVLSNSFTKDDLTQLVLDNILIQYDVPCKTRKINSFLINPLNKIYANCIINKFNEKANKINKEIEVYRKYKNTIDFLEHININDLYRPMPK